MIIITFSLQKEEGCIKQHVQYCLEELHEEGDAYRRSGQGKAADCSDLSSCSDCKRCRDRKMRKSVYSNENIDAGK